MTIGQAYNLFLERAKLKSTSLRNYKTQYKAYIKKYEDMSVTDITDSFARGFLKSLGRLQINSIIEAKCVFTSVLNEAIKEGVILTHPFKDIKIRKTPPIRRPQPFTVEEIQAIMEAAEKEGWFVNFLAFLLLTGMRIGEALALHWENIKKDKIVITKSIYHGVIDTTKTNVAREIPILNALRPFINNQKKYGTDGRIFKDIQGSDSVFYRWKRIRKTCGLEGRVLSNTRHTFIKRAIESGMKSEYLSLIIGHSNPQTVLKYYIRFLDAERIDLNFTTLR